MRRYELHSTLALNMGNIKPFSQSENDHTVLEVKSVTKNTRRKTIVSVSWEDVGHRPDRLTTRYVRTVLFHQVGTISVNTTPARTNKQA